MKSILVFILFLCAFTSTAQLATKETWFGRDYFFADQPISKKTFEGHVNASPEATLQLKRSYTFRKVARASDVICIGVAAYALIDKKPNYYNVAIGAGLLGLVLDILADDKLNNAITITNAGFALKF